MLKIRPKAGSPDTVPVQSGAAQIASTLGMCWRRKKISQLSSPELFSQEYPLVASETFISSDFDCFISPGLVVRARREQIEPYGPLLIGVDPEGKGADSTAIA